MLNRLTEKMNLNDDLNEKIRRLEHRLSLFDKSKEKDFNLNSFNGGVFLDLIAKLSSIIILYRSITRFLSPEELEMFKDLGLKKPEPDTYVVSSFRFKYIRLL